MSDDRWIWIPNWDEFQHYKDRDPRWIKCYTRLLSHDEYRRLTFPQRGLLHCIWMEYARSSRNTLENTSKLPANTLELSRRIGGKVLQKSLQSLCDAGFIQILDSKTLAERYHAASPEKRREEKTTGVVLEATGYPPALVWQESDKPPDLSFITGGASEN